MFRLFAVLFAALSASLLLPWENADGQITKPDKPKKSPLKFAAFVDHVKEASYESYKKEDGFKAENKPAFEAMRSYVAKRAKGHTVKHTFLSKNGHPIDCVPIHEQPSLQHALLVGHKVQLAPTATPPVSAKGDKKAPGEAKYAGPTFGKGEMDVHGNEMIAPQGTIPIRRVTLEDVARFKSLKDFLSKHPSGGATPLAKPAVTGTHRYSVGYQNVGNVGGTSWLNVWKPVPKTNEFSLSQVWFTAGSPVQTIEAGWQVYPRKYGHANPVLFIYWTADGYNKTGNYNLDAPAFVQTNKSYVIGGSLAPVSTTGGTQYGVRISWFKDSGTHNWWLFVQGGGANTPIGYYPATLFGSGPMSKAATNAEYGGEVTGSVSGQMGSGAYANSGFGKAAFQKDIAYYPNTTTATRATLSPIVPNPACYSIAQHNNSGSAWGTYFYFGGPKCP